MAESDKEAIGRVMTTFLRTVSFAHGETPSYERLRALFVRGASLIRNSGAAPEVWTIDEFVRARQAVFDAGELTSFEETELSETTELFGNIAHRFSAYAKRGTTPREQIEARGAISTQFVRTADGWLISSMIWDDERPGLTLPGAAGPFAATVEE